MTQWAVLIEQNEVFNRLGDTYARWMVAEGREAADRDDAVALAEELATSHNPGIGTEEIGRSVFRVSESELLVVVESAWKEKRSFRLTIVEHVGDYQAPRPI